MTLLPKILFRTGMILLSGWTAFSGCAATPVNLAQTKAGLRALELQTTKLISQGNYTAVAAVLDDRYLSTNYHGVTRDKATMLKLIRYDYREIKEPHYDTMDIRVFGDCAVLSGIYSQALTYNQGKPNATCVAYSDVLIKKNGKWFYVMSQTTKLSGAKSAKPKPAG